MTFVSDRRYDFNDPETISSEDFLSSKTQMSRFLGRGGDSVLKSMTPDAKADLARQLYLHAEAVDMIENTPYFANSSLVVSEPVFTENFVIVDPESGESCTDDKSINEKKRTGEAIVYSLIDEYGVPNASQNFELAVFLKDTIRASEIILDYDTYNTNGELNVNVIIVFPEVDDNFSLPIAPNASVKTWFNNMVISSTDLFELE